MAKKRRRAKKANPKKRTHARTRRKRTANPKRSHARRTYRRRAANPKRSHARRKHKRNPGFAPKRRRSRRNPSGPLMDLGVGVLVGGAAFLGTIAIGYFVTDDQVKNGQRNRGIVGALATAGGAYLAPKHPAIGLGLALGSLLGAFGGMAMAKMFDMLPAKRQSNTGAVYADNMAAVYADDMGAVYADNMAGYAQIGEYSQIGDYEQIGAVTPAAPWNTPTPFG